MFGIQKELNNELLKQRCTEFADALCNLDKKTKRNVKRISNRLNLWMLVLAGKQKKYKKIKYLMNIQNRTKNQRSKLRLENRISKLILSCKNEQIKNENTNKECQSIVETLLINMEKLNNES